MASCPITGENAQVEADGDAELINSARTNGRYRVSRTAIPMLAALTVAERMRLVTWIVNQRRFGEGVPEISSETVRAAKALPRMRTAARRDRFFLAMMRAEPTPGFRFGLGEAVSEGGTYTDRLCAWLECDPRDLSQFLKALSDEGYLRLEDAGFGRIFFTTKGLEKLEALEGANPESQQAFVAMWFGAEMNEPWRLAFAPGIRDAGFTPFRVDRKEHNNKIDDEIVAEIKRSRFLVADFTCGAEDVKGKQVAVPRGGVYYEAGLAHGLGMEVIFSCRADRINDLHFDTRQFSHIVWNNPAELRTALYNRIAATVKEAPGAPGRGKGSIDPA